MAGKIYKKNLKYELIIIKIKILRKLFLLKKKLEKLMIIFRMMKKIKKVLNIKMMMIQKIIII